MNIISFVVPKAFSFPACEYAWNLKNTNSHFILTDTMENKASVSPSYPSPLFLWTFQGMEMDD